MAAIVYLSETNGPTGAPVVTNNLSNCNFGSFDAPNLVPGAHPIIVGENSFTKYWRVRVFDLDTSSIVKDFRFWKSAGNYLSGESIIWSSSGFSYATPTAAPVSGVNIDVANPGSENIFIGGGSGGEITVAPNYSDYFRVQLRSTLSTPAIDAEEKTFFFQYDET